MKLTRSNIQVNALARNCNSTDTFCPERLPQGEKCRQHVRFNVPTNRVGAAKEPAELAACLASENCRHRVVRLIPLAGGRVN